MRYFADLDEDKGKQLESFNITSSKQNAVTQRATSVGLHLSDEQQDALDAIIRGDSIVIEACVGAGKTTFLQAVCQTFRDKRILYLTYNRLLKLDAQKKIAGANVTVQNYHGFVYKYLTRRGIHVEPSKQIRTFLDKCSDVPLIYDLIMIDEVQDLEEDTTDLLLYIAKECPKAQWVFVGDMAQKIYDKTKIDVYKDCVEKIIPNYVPMSFTKSFRISYDHSQFLSSLWSKQITGVNPNCQVSTTTNFKEVLALLDATPNDQLLILGPRYGLTQELVNMLERHNPQKYNKQTVWTSIRDRDENFQIQPHSMIVTTYDGCKGMERPVCVVIDWTNSHFKNRVEKPFVDQTIIRNLFCVAASRGKDKILFYSDPTRPGEHLLRQRDLTLSYTQDLPTFEPSQMFSFKHPADILRCLDSVKVEEIEQKDIEPIEVLKADGNIDLTPAIGIYQEITFFKYWNFEKHLNALEDKPILNRVKKWIADQGKLTDEQKALALTAYSTELFRYCNQASQNFISPAEHQRLFDRLKSKLNPDSKKIQAGCHIVSEFSAFGFLDYVDENNIPWELKFVGNLSNENILQAAIYSLMYKSPYVYLWNTRVNDLRKVSVTNKEQFLSDVYTCITMGRKLRRY